MTKIKFRNFFVTKICVAMHLEHVYDALLVDGTATTKEREHRQDIFRGRCPAVVAELPVSVSVSVSVLTTATA